MEAGSHAHIDTPNLSVRSAPMHGIKNEMTKPIVTYVFVFIAI